MGTSSPFGEQKSILTINVVQKMVFQCISDASLFLNMTLCFLLLFSVDQKAETDRHLIMAAILESFRVKAHIKASLKINLTHVFDFLMITDWMSDSLTIDSFRYIFIL